MRLAFLAYLDAIGEDVARIDDAARTSLVAPIPNLAGWDTGQLVAHLTRLYGFWAAQLKAADATEKATSPVASPGADPLEELELGATLLLAELADAGPDATCWNWSGEDQTGSWLARRMAHETSIHRVDAELAFGAAAPIERDLAVDGIDERMEVFLVDERGRPPTGGLGGSLCLVCSDADAAWTLSADRGKLRWRRGRAPADAALVGRASELDLFVWNRLDLVELELTGQRSVAESWRGLPGP